MIANPAPAVDAPRPIVTGHAVWRVVVLSLATALLTCAAALVMFSALMYYDDEGYVLLSLENFARHGGLYREVYSQYGPFPFALHWALHLAGMPFTHLAGRLLTLALWAGTAIACAQLVNQGTRSFSTSLAVLAAVFAYLWVMANEPSHPGGLILFVIAVMAALGYRWLLHGRNGNWAVLIGGGIAALTLTKINIGAFAALSVLAWMLLHARSDWIRRAAPLLAGVGAVLVPLLLMRPLIGSPWVQTYALVFGCSALAAIGAAARSGVALVGTSEIRRALVTAAIVAAATAGIVMARGTSAADLISGVVLDPLRHPVNFSIPFRWAPGAAAVALASAAGCLALLLWRRRRPDAADTIVAVLRVAATLGLATAILRIPAASPDRTVLAYGPSALWFFLWPLPGESDRSRCARHWVGLLALGQLLHAYPVPGSQIAWGTFLLLPLAALGGVEALAWLAPRLSSRAAFTPRATILGRAAAIAFAVAVTAKFAQIAARYQEGSELGLPGAEFIRVPSETAAAYRVLCVNATAHADLLFSEPGMFSFNLWTERPTPTLANVTHWFTLLPEGRQHEIIAALEANPAACVIVQRRHLEFLRAHGIEPVGPLHDYIARHFRPAFSVHGFDFCVKGERKIDPLFLGELLFNPGAGPRTENTALRIRLLVRSDRPVAKIVIETADPATRLVLQRGQARLEAALTDLRGTRSAALGRVEWPLRLNGPTTVMVHFDRFAHPPPVAGGIVRLLDADGNEVALGLLERPATGRDLRPAARQ